MKHKIPDKVLTILQKLNAKGYEAYIVGGCVRDSIMGRMPKDWDVTTSAKPLAIKEIFPHTFDTGIAHGTVTVVLEHENFEVTTYRIDGNYTDCRHPDAVRFTESLTEDLRRRDFTMNAIAYHPAQGFCDPFFGRKAIENGIIQGVGDPLERFQEDALRMLRAIRFAAQLGFSIEERTFCAIEKKAQLLQKISVERIREELEKLLLADFTEKIPLLWESSLLSYIHPELFKMASSQSRELVAVWKRYVMQRSEKRCVSICFALLLRILPLDMAEPFLIQLKFDKRTMHEILMLLQNEGKALFDDKVEIRRTASKLGSDNLSLLLEYQKILEKEESFKTIAAWEQILKNGDPLFIGDLQINGTDLMALGAPKGKKIGGLLSALLAEVHKDPSKNNKETLAKMAKEKIARD